MNREEAKDYLIKEFLSNIDSTIPIHLENYHSFIFSNGNSTTKPSDSLWIRFWVDDIDSNIYSFGETGHRRLQRYGMINYQVFVPPNTGTKTGGALCQEINNIFEIKRFENIHCQEGTYRKSGIQDDGFFMYVGTIIYYLYNIK